MSVAPTLEVERGLGGAVAGMDEVGRGALAGPVSVGVVLVDPSLREAPEGLRDSKLLRPAAREALVGPLISWCLGWGVGHAEAAEVDALGVVAALRLAGRRALAALPAVPSVVLLDGSHDWLTNPMQEGLLAPHDAPPPVRTMVKADLRCASVAAASVLAKVARDTRMVRLDAVHPGFGLAGNKGYGAAVHLEQLRRVGPTPVHRRTWRLPEVDYGVPVTKERRG